MQSGVTSGLTLQVTLQQSALAGFPSLQSEARAAQSRRAIAAAFPATALIYFELDFSAAITATGGTLSLTPPSGALVAGDVYYLAYFDPNALALGWQLDWSGPAAITGGGLTFSLPSINFHGLTTYGLAIYGISSSASPPTPVPTATASPTAGPTASPSAAPSASPSASGSPTASPSPSPSPTATATATPTPSPSPTSSAAPNALSANPTTVEIPGPGTNNAQTVVVSESGYSGTLSQTNSCSTGTAVATFSATSAAGPTWNLVVTGVSAGTCIATISDTNGQSVTLNVTVTSSGFSIQSVHRKETP